MSADSLPYFNPLFYFHEFAAGDAANRAFVRSLNRCISAGGAYHVFNGLLVFVQFFKGLLVKLGMHFFNFICKIKAP